MTLAELYELRAYLLVMARSPDVDLDDINAQIADVDAQIAALTA